MYEALQRSDLVLTWYYLHRTKLGGVLTCLNLPRGWHCYLRLQQLAHCSSELYCKVCSTTSTMQQRACYYLHKIDFLSNHSSCSPSACSPLMHVLLAQPWPVPCLPKRRLPSSTSSFSRAKRLHRPGMVSYHKACWRVALRPNSCSGKGHEHAITCSTSAGHACSTAAARRSRSRIHWYLCAAAQLRNKAWFPRYNARSFVCGCWQGTGHRIPTP